MSPRGVPARGWRMPARADLVTYTYRPDEVDCPECNHPVSVRWSHEGAHSRRTRCGECGAVFRVQLNTRAGIWHVFPPERRTEPD